MKLACDYFVNRVNACVNIFLSRVNALLTHTLSVQAGVNYCMAEHVDAILSHLYIEI